MNRALPAEDRVRQRERRVELPGAQRSLRTSTESPLSAMILSGGVLHQPECQPVRTEPIQARPARSARP